MHTMSDVLMTPMWALFLAFAGIWIILHGIKIVLGQGDIFALGKEFIFVFIAAVLLAGQGAGLVSNLFVASVKIMGAAAAVAIKAASAGGSTANIDPVMSDPDAVSAGMSALMLAAENGIVNVFRMAGRIASATSISDPLPILYAILLVVPYFILLFAYFSQVVVSVFRVTVLAALSPWLMLAFGFGWGRDMSKAAIRTWIASFVVLFGATIAVAIVLYATSKLGVGETGQDIQEIADIANPKLILAIALGWMGSAFLTEATGMANSITQSALTNSAIGMITGGAAGSALFAAKRLKNTPMLNVASQAAGAGVSAAWHPKQAAAAGANAVSTGVGAFASGVSNLSTGAQALMEHIRKTRKF